MFYPWETIEQILAKKDLCILGEAGTGGRCRILSVLVAAVEKLLRESRRPRTKSPAPSLQSEIDHHNVLRLYESYKREQRRNVGSADKVPKGVLVISPSADVVAQRYAFCRQLDPRQKLRMCRLGSALQAIGPTVGVSGSVNQLSK